MVIRLGCTITFIRGALSHLPVAGTQHAVARFQATNVGGLNQKNNMKRRILFQLTAAILLLAIPVTAGSSLPEFRGKTVLYFVRHGEDSPELTSFDPSFSVVFNNCTEDAGCCEEVLNPLGQARAVALADWFETRRIAPTLTHVIASHKIRTRQTVARIALAAGLGGDLDGDGDLDGTDTDQAPGDGVINVPSAPLECDAGFTSSSSVLQPQIDYLKTLPRGSKAVVCSHSPVMYPLMQAFGIDTSDPVKFPKDSRGRVSGFNNVWIVEFDRVKVGGEFTYQGRLLAHVQLDLKLEVSDINH
jgi:phosphohistidine phosphatase SixA